MNRKLAAYVPLVFALTAATASAAPPQLNLTASPNSIKATSSSTLSWSSKKTASCTASGAWSGVKSVRGSQVVTPMSTSSYTLTCSGPSGSVSHTTTVSVTTVVPTASIAASPASITAGSSSKLTWSSSNATSCAATGGWSGSLPVSGTQNVTPAATTAYGITCSGSSGSGSASTTVSVTAANPTASIAATPTAITTGSSSGLTWSATNATSCTATGGWSGSIPVAGTQNVTPAATTSYGITCSGGGGSASASTTVSVNAAAPTASIAASPTSITAGSSSKLTWSSTNATSCTATGGWSGSLAVSGTQNVTPATTTSYGITCSGSGGSAGATANVSVSSSQPSGSYGTTFDATENPLSDSGHWINGQVAGIDWHNMQAGSGRAYATAINGGYDDSIAVLTTAFGGNQFAQGTVYRDPGYSPGTNHEIELLLRFRITAHNARGYEVLWGQEGELNVVRWNGALGDFTALGPNAGYGPNIGPAANGDVVRAEISGNIVSVYVNGTLRLTVDVSSQGGTVWTDGQPGVGSWLRSGATPSSYGWTAYSAGGL